MENKLMLIPEISQQEFDFDTMIGDKSYTTLAGLPVKIDRIIRDVTKTTVIAISGIMTLRGVKIRGVWDMYGNIVRCKEIISLFVPKSFFTNIHNLFEGTTPDMFNLVSIQPFDKDKSHEH